MAGHSRSKNGVASLAYVPAIHVCSAVSPVDARHKAGHDGRFLRPSFCANPFSFAAQALRHGAANVKLGASKTPPER
jgi:hypothetical protein